MKDKIEKRIVTILEDKGFGGSVINLDTNLKRDLGLDSLEQIEIIMEVEREFNISIDDEAAEKVNTLGELVDLVHERTDTRQHY